MHPRLAAMTENAEGDLNSNLLHAPYHTGDPQLDTAIGQWLRWDKVGTWSAGHPPPPPARPPTPCTPLPVPTRCSAGCGGDGSGHAAGASGAGRCHPPMPVLPPWGRLSWERTPVVASFCRARNCYLPSSSPLPAPLQVCIRTVGSEMVTILLRKSIFKTL